MMRHVMRQAKEDDFENMIALWLSQYPKEDPRVGEEQMLVREERTRQKHRPTEAQIESTKVRWQGMITDWRKQLWVFYEEEELQGFGGYEDEDELQAQITDFVVRFPAVGKFAGARKTSPEQPEGGAAGKKKLTINTEPEFDMEEWLLTAVVGDAFNKGYCEVSWYLSSSEEWKIDLAKTYGAEQKAFYGCNYTWYAEYVWKAKKKEDNDMALSPAARRARLQNEWKTMIEPMNRPGFLEITQTHDYSQIHVTVYAPSYVVGRGGGEPTLKHMHKFTVYVGSNYPMDKPRASFDDKNERIAHINVWETGNICIGEWSPQMCNVGTIINKVVHAIGFDPTNWRKDSMACSANLPFLERKEREGVFPLFDLKKIPNPGQKAEAPKKRSFRLIS